MTIDKGDYLVRSEEAKYDRSCPYYKFLCQDILKSSYYDHYCTLEYQWDVLHGLPMDFEFCNQEEHNQCPRFLKEQRIIRAIEHEREVIVNSIPFGD